VHDNAETRADRRRLTTDVADVVHTYHPSDTDQANDALRIPKLQSPRRTRRSSGSRSGSTLPTRYR
jgi:pyocin large subunit-like protein